MTTAFSINFVLWYYFHSNFWSIKYFNNSVSTTYSKEVQQYKWLGTMINNSSSNYMDIEQKIEEENALWDLK